METGCTAGTVCNGSPCTDYTSGTCFKNVLTVPVVADMDQVLEPELVWTSPLSGITTTFPAGKYPEVAFKAYAGGNLDDCRIVILDGRTGQTKKIIARDRGGYGHLTLGNLDSDAKLELINY